MSNLLDFYRATMSECEYFGERFPRLAAAWHVWTCALWAPTLCRMLGHRYENIAHDAENGSEDIQCNRCGLGHHVQF